MKPLKLGLRIWIGLASLLSFLGGWALFSHAGKPAPLIGSSTAAGGQESTQQINGAGVQFAPIPTLPPAPSLGDPAQGSRLQPLPALPANVQPNFMPRFTTRGS